jgi:hypothetical protein
VNSYLNKEIAQQHVGDLRRAARARKAPTEPVDHAEKEDVTVRAASQRDREAVRLLAALEGVNLPSGQMLVAQVGDEVVAALPLDGGRALADPFRRTQHLVAMLELRARQLREQDESARRPLWPRLRDVVRAA